MSHERDRRERSQLQHEAEHSRPKRRSASVMSYLAILFGAAFLLLLLSYFMQQRTSEETISGLKDSVNSFQSVGNLVEQNQALQEQAKALQEQVDALEEQLADAEAQGEAQQTAQQSQTKAMQAMDWFWRIQRAYSRGAKSEAKTLAQDFEATGLPSSLPQTSTAVSDGPSPAEQYDALLQAMGLKTTAP